MLKEISRTMAGQETQPRGDDGLPAKVGYFLQLERDNKRVIYKIVKL